ncbi:HigA family addiction module antitoxin [Curtobacterium flaccumfaciens]|uniref:HigA family addiction module antitoxin n=1 Tax=Curtobacterium flaccumfaciens TaxID=2035 RepID=UPI001BDDF9F4|nr:HigA family addiction module antitoxin [Curtobacterium flaccumfaciens]MBT1606350.1 HigA family addiction module antidote protein [Curtobacterium flaccumfaciens pv. betae]MBT1657741.1 HigA family addiction module antidote protein [Curtobacterium flaccumfaciens pv. betae]MCS0472129.1 HigA family addiction module antitoxin [Curtobacterium flaccumfaciens pv. betae]MCS0475574.1 HigA family addiction module antitoxin [Curtobacterium flaccumfaciens pv. betae]MCS0478869.1 HigA family addiction modu
MTQTNYAVAPGEYLEEWIEDRGLSQADAANLLGCSRKQVNEIVNGRAPITADTALRLQRVVGIPAQTWLRYEAAYRADRARIEDEERLADHVDEISPNAATYLRAVGATTATKRDPGRLVSDFLAYHGCGTWDAYLHLHETATRGDYALAALKDSKATLEPTVLSTWLRAAEQTPTFETGRTHIYNSDELIAALPRLRERAATPNSSMLRDIARMLAEVGVVFMVVDPPSKFPLLGMTRWIDERVPVIQQTGRWGKDGFVIWTLFHELGHVLNDPRGEMHLEYNSEKQRNSEAEKSANAFAMRTLFGDAGVAPFRGLTSDADIRRKATAIGIAPGVAVHQMHRRRMLDYGWGNRLCVDLAGTFND